MKNTLGIASTLILTGLLLLLWETTGTWTGFVESLPGMIISVILVVVLVYFFYKLLSKFF